MPNVWIKVIHTLQDEAVGNLTGLRTASQDLFLPVETQLLCEFSDIIVREQNAARLDRGKCCMDIPESQHAASIGAECALPLSHRPTSRRCPDMTAHCVCPARPKPLAAGRN
ncbi:hypothetical protein Q8A67_020537 [Cirrhinus molitorella]|uniref:Uncharacterized protein n=1 Tax=Cirrhinus molitorella TaxID=172907 RepID=A0AA88TH20_9TELE|nr:hypothetical protein Q8A67_020537 [Cirrhinus molitorella]